jgi:hypothetical protein
MEKSIVFEGKASGAEASQDKTSAHVTYLCIPEILYGTYIIESKYCFN